MNKIITYIFLCVCLITLLLSQFEFAYSIDLGTDIAGIMDTSGFSYSSGSIEATKKIGIFVIIVVVLLGHYYLLYLAYKHNKFKVVINFVKNLVYYCVQLLFIIILITILESMSFTCKKPSRAQARQKFCYSNMRVLNSAVEMYNMDADKGHMMDELDISRLTSTSYLKYAPTCPETGRSEEYSGSNLTTTGQVHCLYDKADFPEFNHGYLDR